MSRLRIAKPGPVKGRRWTPVTVANAAVALALECGMLVALFCWGLATGTNTVWGIVIGAASAALAAVVWGTFLAAGGPKVPLPVGAEITVKLAVFGVAALALADFGRTTLTLVLAGLAVISVAVEYTAVGPPPETRDDALAGTPDLNS
ncbi:YrdB family protein [Streptomyces sp. NBC_00237]|uniref:YrdB family protein n=1 Tax=Streptomyces sp. NBC_00237 TaxID=2975687 RepID=UPI002251C67B|nr:YrdB family protein [Streptomyces sp. NBC_00237]MCX5207164.1 YrdB family protein [Streptomyces sp. NBC_00237]